MLHTQKTLTVHLVGVPGTLCARATTVNSQLWPWPPGAHSPWLGAQAHPWRDALQRACLDWEMQDTVGPRGRDLPGVEESRAFQRM